MADSKITDKAAATTTPDDIDTTPSPDVAPDSTPTSPAAAASSPVSDDNADAPTDTATEPVVETKTLLPEPEPRAKAETPADDGDKSLRDAPKLPYRFHTAEGTRIDVAAAQGDRYFSVTINGVHEGAYRLEASNRILSNVLGFGTIRLDDRQIADLRALDEEADAAATSAKASERTDGDSGAGA